MMLKLHVQEAKRRLRHGGLHGCYLEPPMHACSSILVVSTLEGAFNFDTL